jgi:thiol-disulfide isomerase/thioredoxin
MRTARTLVSGILSPLLAAGLGMLTYGRLTQASADVDEDFVFRLLTTTFAMTVPFWVTLLLAERDRSRARFGKASGTGLGLAVLSLVLAWVPVQGLIARSRQATALALAGVEAPPMDTVDIAGKSHKLSDHRGRVVLLNIWATWCGPCREEMPKLDRLYRERRDRGLMVFGLSTEDLDLQRKFAKEQVSVSYPLLTLQGNVPAVYRTTARYPANFLIDRAGRFRPAPSAEEPFENLAAKVDELLATRE